MKRIYCILMVLFPLSLSAQDIYDPGFSLGFTPQFMIVNGLKLDWEAKVNERNQWVQLSPHLYYEEGQSMDIDKHIGFGIDIHYKIYLTEEKPGLGAYFSYGGVFRSHSINYQGYEWNTYERDNLGYYEYGLSYKKQNILKTGPDLMFGYRWMPFKRLFIDTYIGGGLRISFHSGESETDRDFANSMADYGYSGTLIISGIQVGVLF